MTRDCTHTTGDDQRLRTQYRRSPETADIVQEMTRNCRTVQEMTRDCGHSTGDTRDCRHSTGDDQKLQT
ncbi:unnamed protein product [Staurois parvus]|uniref:Uncharacterized protein n=1 Tax=Staurois parvus TaxID=386267 RepID=A0ABN9CQR9_9NEOB|nr:unnamed protein product [Staurois parvus]